MSPKKHLGQHFLSDPYIVEQIIRSMHIREEDRIVEIGPGQGALTRQLLKLCNELYAIEYDADLIPYLQNKHPNLNLFHQDALTFDFQQLATEKKLRIIGNLPYNISTPLIFHFLKYSEHIVDMTLMLQKEVAERICANPGSKQYGRLTIMTQYHCSVEKILDVPDTAFFPPPKVQSAVIRLQPFTQENNPFPNISLEVLSKIVTEAFSHRRKTLRNALKLFLTDTTLEKLDIDPQARPETLTIAQFISIAKILQKTDF
ncbi:MAG TPA: 16S rRNA (adenine(1518)-N(6)/adenine(1519)-N(6))-dimethyltransferase RsmA [Gammaproteobacteria bacterium]|nr:16S rRNA (adenine(1518)-N(6)/adenine(1519)-N(6))-dimethyltransferase RsmA [Gammaproteobacteria bacterium]